MTDPARFVADLLDAHNRRDDQFLAGQYTADASVHLCEAQQPVSAAAWLAVRRGMAESFGDLAFSAGAVAVTAGTVFFEITITGTNDGPLFLNDADRMLLRCDDQALPPTGRAMHIDGVIVLELTAARIDTERHYLNLAAVHEQLLLAAPEQGVLQ